ncbi:MULTISPECIES: DsrE family protein [unclassified Cryobacterium]|uniref:DsrE family protein n=1 Tax=unclassified Cryobacterium TaxID=2649013 RepID=UPI002AB58412|nr:MULTISPECIES: DsrE family protein [unclassified Cryobacterium]MDY7528231.1 DsrE family protein [Cryobacterium sp. 10C2]MEB0002384.1 DsrE family protein [Cryobacterium sp. RTC2.1]
MTEVGTAYDTEPDGGGRGQAVTGAGLLLHVSGADAPLIQAGIRSALNASAQLPTLTIEIVVQGSVVLFLRARSDLENALTELAATPVRVLSCQNSMRSVGLDAADLLPSVSVVPAAVAHLTARQFEGWAYIRV